MNNNKSNILLYIKISTLYLVKSCISFNQVYLKLVEKIMIYLSCHMTSRMSEKMYVYELKIVYGSI